MLHHLSPVIGMMFRMDTVQRICVYKLAVIEQCIQLVTTTKRACKPTAS